MSNETDEEYQDENEELQNGTEEIVHVPLAIQVGDRFSSFAEFKEKFDTAARDKLVRFSKRDSRTLAAAKRKVRRPLNPELEFYHLRYACFYSQKNRPRGTGKRNRRFGTHCICIENALILQLFRSLARQFEVSCPAYVSLKATEDGQFLEVYSMEDGHNHPVNQDVFTRLMPKKSSPSDLLFVCADKMTEDGDLSSEYKFNIILRKCRHIAKLGSMASMDRLQEIVRNLDDYIYYLKYTSKTKGIEQLEADDQETQSNSDDAMQDTPNDESIKIIVEPADVMD